MFGRKGADGAENEPQDHATPHEVASPATRKRTELRKLRALHPHWRAASSKCPAAPAAAVPPPPQATTVN